MYLLGYDIGSSSVKASLVEVESGQCVAQAFAPSSEAPITALQAGWAEQNPEDWWRYLQEATAACLAKKGLEGSAVAAIGISYQMHGLVCCDKEGKPLRPAIIWCDSRAIPYGNLASRELGSDFCMKHLLNLPGNFTASKLAWVKEKEPHLYSQIDKIMLPGDYIAMRLTGECATTLPGLSEATLWDFKKNDISDDLLQCLGLDRSLLPPIVPTFGEQGRLLSSAASLLGLPTGIPVTYRAGDQPNNALSLGVLNAGEIAATAGTSGVVYGISDTPCYDTLSRVNVFAHVNHNPPARTRLGVLLCINGTGILNSWLHHNVVPQGVGYNEMDELAARIPVGSEGLTILPFGNGAERILQNRETGCVVNGLNFNIHTRNHLLRAAQEGIAFSFKYGMEIMEEMGMEFKTIHAGKANLFLSPLFREALATLTGSRIELYDTDGAAGAARGAGMGAGIYHDSAEAFAGLTHVESTLPQAELSGAYEEAYERWKINLLKY